MRHAIDTAALTLFSERGYDEVTTDEIAAAAGVSASIYYRHVPTKEDLLLRPVRASSAAIVERFAAHTTSTPEHDLIEAIRDQAATGADGPSQWREVIAGVPGILDRITLIADDDRGRLIEIAAHRLGVDADDDLRPGVLVVTVLAVVEYAYRRWMTATDNRSLADYIDAALAAR
ncbi:TetR family transcriptional regulator [Gordonia amarae]|uniref:TetR family transcriptional regulator n=2 Tax=Gordonia amarae TaxID=36821 RepID=A0A857L7H1_9ACTN|nr:TetR/AcrR family transcriptional regulator [Gordonia amarae]MCS3876665.1 AcrR family transcriptional regulator [Gordonia amarae]QHN19548.1 TetR family transcriptional regulator [Gordonia amarae]QHN24017.1 TetR family transcriptional regulator [Gordonia amarae]QHN32934.1 TetR family transcriptional regulator [Gordonia amarae]QHN41655.1 TetR family transcriptional regulator [Gordonia amarae]